MKKVLVVILFIIVYQKAFPQLFTNPSFKHLPVKNLGLKTAYGQTWDKEGNMWMVYEDGIFVITVIPENSLNTLIKTAALF
ncbi:MAG: hypothetical protein IPJ32_19205 [Sphingobacteriaceae bacterium]|nr:hypothetical protein [Sphingobacteriaceae bacterium]